MGENRDISGNVVDVVVAAYEKCNAPFPAKLLTFHAFFPSSTIFAHKSFPTSLIHIEPLQTQSFALIFAPQNTRNHVRREEERYEGDQGRQARPELLRR